MHEHNCFIPLICFKHFSKARKDRYIFLLNVYFVKIKNEHGNVLNNLLFDIIIVNLFEINILLSYEPTAQHCIQMFTCIRDQ